MIWEGKEVLHLVLMKDPFERIMNGTKQSNTEIELIIGIVDCMVKILNGFTFIFAYHKNPTHMVVEVTDVQIKDRWELHLER